jgi:hypothetical protein
MCWERRLPALSRCVPQLAIDHRWVNDAAVSGLLRCGALWRPMGSDGAGIPGTLGSFAMNTLGGGESNFAQPPSTLRPPFTSPHQPNTALDCTSHCVSSVTVVRCFPKYRTDSLWSLSKARHKDGSRPPLSYQSPSCLCTTCSTRLQQHPATACHTLGRNSSACCFRTTTRPQFHLNLSCRIAHSLRSVP